MTDAQKAFSGAFPKAFITLGAIVGTFNNGDTLTSTTTGNTCIIVDASHAPVYEVSTLSGQLTNGDAATSSSGGTATISAPTNYRNCAQLVADAWDAVFVGNPVNGNINNAISALYANAHIVGTANAGATLAIDIDATIGSASGQTQTVALGFLKAYVDTKEVQAVTTVKDAINTVTGVADTTVASGLTSFKNQIVAGELSLPVQERDTLAFAAFKTTARAKADTLIGKTGITRTIVDGHTSIMRFHPNEFIDTSIDLSDATLVTAWDTLNDTNVINAIAVLQGSVGQYLDTVAPDNGINVYQTL